MSIQNIFCWNRQPDHEDIINIVHQMYAKDGITRDEVIRVVDTFPNQGTSPLVSVVAHQP